MTMNNGLPQDYWDSSEILFEVLNDADEDWQRVREDAYDCARLNYSAVVEPSDEVRGFLQERNRQVMERVVRRLLGFGKRRKVLDVLQQRLADIVHLGGWLGRTEVADVSSARAVFQRACDVARWILNSKFRELDRLGIGTIGLSRQITSLETNPRDDEALKAVDHAHRVLVNCLPLAHNDLGGGGPDRRQQPKPIPPPREGDYDVLVIANDGFRIVNSNGRTRHAAKLPKRLHRLLAAVWAYSSAQNKPLERGDDDPRLNEPVTPYFIISDLRRLIGKTASRTNVCTLRKYLRHPDGTDLITEGTERMGYVDFAVDTAGKAPGETLRAYLHRFLKEQDVKLPDGAVA